MTIKHSAGKLALPQPPNPWLIAERERHLIESLPIDERSVAHLSGLEPHHRDPFDRIIVCQAIEHELHVVTVDPLLTKYRIKVLTAQ